MCPLEVEKWKEAGEFWAWFAARAASAKKSPAIEYMRLQTQTPYQPFCQRQTAKSRRVFLLNIYHDCARML